MTNSDLENFIKSHEARQAFSVSVACLFIDNNKNEKRVFSRQGGVKRPAASLAKLFILGALAEEIACRRCSLTKQITVSSYVLGSGILKYVGMPITFTVQELAYIMIIYSDNNATNALLSLITVERVNKFIDSLEANNTKIIVPMMPNTTEAERGYNYTTADDIILFFRGVINGFPAPLHQSTAWFCRELLAKKNGLFTGFVKFLTSKINTQCAMKIIRYKPLKLFKYLYAISNPLWNKRLTAHIPTKQIIVQKNATSRNTFHDSCIIKLPNGFLCIVAMIEYSNANFYKRKSKSYKSVNIFLNKVGKMLLIIQK